jgi:hypothetical protein
MEHETKYNLAERLLRKLGEHFRTLTRKSQEDLIWVYKQQEPTLEGGEKLFCQRRIRLYEHIYNGEPVRPFRIPERLKWNTLGLRERESIVKIVRALYKDGLVTEEVLEHYNLQLAESRERLLRIPEHPCRPS